MKSNNKPTFHKIQSLEKKIKKVSSEKIKKELQKELAKLLRELEKNNDIYCT